NSRCTASSSSPPSSTASTAPDRSPWCGGSTTTTAWSSAGWRSELARLRCIFEAVSTLDECEQPRVRSDPPEPPEDVHGGSDRSRSDAPAGTESKVDSRSHSLPLGVPHPRTPRTHDPVAKPGAPDPLSESDAV